LCHTSQRLTFAMTWITTSSDVDWRAVLAGCALFFLSMVQPVNAIPPAGGSPPAALVGDAQVVDGDTLDVAGERVRLEGIDAPEMSQTCTGSGGTAWDCGLEARRELVRLTQGQTIACDRRGHDKYGRTLAICFVDGEDINGELVKSGLARAFVRYSQEYVADENAARTAKAGLWQGESVAPWDYRKQSWTAAEVKAPSGCAIKGNISKKGHIYHVPWSTWYDKVVIDESKGERWFCTEADALAAGWRAAEPGR